MATSQKPPSARRRSPFLQMKENGSIIVFIIHSRGPPFPLFEELHADTDPQAAGSVGWSLLILTLSPHPQIYNSKISNRWRGGVYRRLAHFKSSMFCKPSNSRTCQQLANGVMSGLPVAQGSMGEEIGGKTTDGQPCSVKPCKMHAMRGEIAKSLGFAEKEGSRCRLQN